MAMDSKGVKDIDFVDLEGGAATGDNGSGVNHAKQLLNKICNGLTGAQRSIRDEEAANLGNGFAPPAIPIENKELPVDKKFGEEESLGFVEKKTEAEQPKKKKAYKKPPKPPRAPRAASLDAVDQKLIQEVSELAMLKRARIERMKALMKMKNSKSSSSNSNLFALIMTVLFCLVIIWQGFCSRSHSKVNFAGSPESSIGTRAQLISVEDFRNVLPSDPNGPTLAAPKALWSSFPGLNGQEEASSILPDESKPRCGCISKRFEGSLLVALFLCRCSPLFAVLWMSNGCNKS